MLDHHSVKHWRIHQLDSGGMLLTADAHAQFDSYAMSINPDVRIPYFHEVSGLIFQDNYEIVCFRRDRKGIFECDFPPSLDMVSEIMSGPEVEKG